MKITKKQLKQIIKEEIQSVVDTANPSISRGLYRNIRASMMAAGYPGPETPPTQRLAMDDLPRDEMLKRDFEDVPNILGLTKDQHLERLKTLSSELDDETAGLVNDYIEAQSRPYAPAGGRTFGDLIGRLNTLLANQS